jgi:energy-coupling factor transporter ATP-binding protein EcfA2
MISRLEIKGFKTLVDVSIELGAVNVFIGANGSGKSNLLEAVGFLSAIVSGSLEAESIRYRGVRLGRPASFQSSLLSQSERAISISACDDLITYEVDFEPAEQHSSHWAIKKELVRLSNNDVLIRSADRVDIAYSLGDHGFDGMTLGGQTRSKSMIPILSPYLAHHQHGIQQKKGAVLASLEDWAMPGDLGQYAIFSPSTPQLRGFLDDIHREPLGLGGSGLGQAIDEMMSGEPDLLGPFDLADIFELIEWADSLQVEVAAGSNFFSAGGPVGLRIGDRFMGETHRSVSLLEASEGALYVLFMLALVGHEQSPKLFAVDNFDQALHPRLARALTRLISEQIVDDGSRQMLATTHNPLVLDGLDLLDDRIRLFTVDRDSSGASQVRRVLVTEDLMAKADQGFSLSQLWTTGRLGGVPKVI